MLPQILSAVTQSVVHWGAQIGAQIGTQIGTHWGVKPLVQSVVQLLLPALCVACGRCLGDRFTPGLCPDCVTELPFWRQDLLPPPTLPAAVDSFAAPFVYAQPVQRLITGLKFGDRLAVVPVLGRYLQDHLPRLTNPLLVPVPIHRTRLRKRLFNQAGLLAQDVSRRTGYPVALTALHKCKATPTQVGQTRAQRLQLRHNVFQADPKQVHGRNVILLDDLWTTGATANTCAAVLKQAGAKRVDVVTVAYVAP